MLHAFTANNKGAVAIVFGILALALIGVIGLAIDLGFAKKTRSEMQNALDRAVLAAVQADEQTEQRQIADQYYSEHGKSGSIIEFTPSTSGSVLSVSAIAEYRMPTFIVGLFGQNHLDVRVKSTAQAPMTISTIQFTPEYARGWWSKTVRLMVRRPGSNVDEEVQRLRYTFIHPSQPTELVVAPPGRVDVGKFDYAYLQMDIDPNSFNKHNDCPSCLTTLRTDDPATSDRLFIDGTQVEQGRKINIFSLVNCDEETRHEWEDGGGHDPDIGYKIEVTCDTPSNMHVRLTE